MKWLIEILAILIRPVLRIRHCLNPSSLGDTLSLQAGKMTKDVEPYEVDPQAMDSESICETPTSSVGQEPETVTTVLNQDAEHKAALSPIKDLSQQSPAGPCFAGAPTAEGEDELDNGSRDGVARDGEQSPSYESSFSPATDQNEPTLSDLTLNINSPEFADSNIECEILSGEVDDLQPISNEITSIDDAVSPPELVPPVDGSKLGHKRLTPQELFSDFTERTRLPRRPAPAEDPSEYNAVVRDVSIIDQEYVRWNRALVEQVLLAKLLSEDIYLCITPRILSAAFAQAGYDLLMPNEAELRFASAVANVYQQRVIADRAGLRTLRRLSQDGSPDCVAFIAASVLAAYHMRSDEEVSGNAYYRRLADIVGCEMSGTHPIGFSAPVFESLWMFLGNWLHEVHGRRLVTPRADVGLRRFVALPLAHVPLRFLDIEKLPAFFVWAEYEPGAQIRADRLLSELQRWQQLRGALTEVGAQALSDNRSQAVVAQVSAELQAWDGAFSESGTRRSAHVEIQFDVVQRQPIISYLPRRPSGFPIVFDDGEHVFEASDEGWYDPIPMRFEDGKLLANGFEWRSAANGIQFMLRRSETLVVPLMPSSTYSGFLSSHHLLRGIKCSVLCREDFVATVVEYLSEAAQQHLTAVRHPLMPEGWSIIRDFAAKVRVAPPAGLEALEINPNIDLLVFGGLRTGRRWEWLAGAPPRVLVPGMDMGDGATVNGAPVETSAGGELILNEILAQPGQYLIEVGGVRRRIEIVSPRISIHRPTDRSDGTELHRTVTIALPHGAWTLIGASPGEICRTGTASFRQGTLAKCTFRPVWAVQAGPGSGAQIAVLAQPGKPAWFDIRQVKGSARNGWERWAGVIYDANVRRPHFFGVNGTVCCDGIEAVWREYAVAAKRIKRSFKRI